MQTPPAGRKSSTEKVGARSEHPLRKTVESIVDRLPATTPFIRVGIGLATIALATSVTAAVVGTPWVHLALEGVSGLFWLAAGVLFIRYVTVHRARFISRVVHWIELTRSIYSKDVRATEAAARQVELDATQAKNSSDTRRQESRSDTPAANP